MKQSLPAALIALAAVLLIVLLTPLPDRRTLPTKPEAKAGLYKTFTVPNREGNNVYCIRDSRLAANFYGGTSRLFSCDWDQANPATTPIPNPTRR